MLCKLYHLYQKSAKSLSELSTHCQKPDDKTIPKSTTKASGTRWMDQWRVMEILFKNYGAYINHLEQLSFINSQALKWPETGICQKNCDKNYMT